jgi:WD40 repeat protein
VTTRNLEIVSAIGAEPHTVDVFEPAQATQLLANWSGQRVSDMPPESREVARECGYLPLALAMIGAMVGRDPSRWANVLHRLRAADIEKIRQQFPDYPYPDLMRAFEVSFAELDSTLRDRYLDFAIFRSGTRIPAAVFETFWTSVGLDKWDTEDAINRFVSLSLARRDDRGRVTLHDLQFDYVRKKVGRLNLPGLHERLLAAYREMCSAHWHTGPNDQYFFEHLLYHLREAGREDELQKLLVDFSWLRAKLNATDVLALIRDYEETPSFIEVDEWTRFLRTNAHLLRRGREDWPAGNILVQLASEYSETVQKSITQWLKNGEFNQLWLRRSSRKSELPNYEKALDGQHTPITGLLRITSEQLLSWSHNDSQLTVWNITNGTEGAKFSRHSGPVIGALLLPDGTVLSWANDTTIYAWDPSSGIAKTEFTGHQEPVSGVTWIGQHKIVSWGGMEVIVWDVLTGSLLRRLDAHTDFVTKVEVLPSGKVVSLSAHAMNVWNTETGEVIALPGVENTENFNCIALSDESILWSGGPFVMLCRFVNNEWDSKPAFGWSDSDRTDAQIDGACLLENVGIVSWDLLGLGAKIWLEIPATPVLYIGGMLDHDRPVNGAAVLESGRVLTWSQDGTLASWIVEIHRPGADEIRSERLSALLDSEQKDNIEDHIAPTIFSKRETTFIGHSGAVHGALQLSEGKIVSWAEDRTIRIWEEPTGRCVQICIGHHGPIGGVVRLDEDSLVSFSPEERKILIWKIAANPLKIAANPLNDESVFKLPSITLTTITPVGQLLTCAKSGDITIWDRQSAQPAGVLKGHSKPILGLTQISRNSIASWSWDRSIRIWDTISMRENAVLIGHNQAIKGCFSFNDALVSWSEKGIRAWNKVGYCFAILEGHTGALSGVQPIDKRTFASWSRDGSIGLWALADGVPHAIVNLGFCQGHEKAVAGLSALDKDRIVSWSWDGTLRLWDSHTATPIDVVKAHDGAVAGALTIPGRASVVSWADDGTIFIWSEEDPVRTRGFKAHQAPILNVMLIGRRRLVSSARDGSMCIWDIDTSERMEEVLLGDGPALDIIATDDERLLVQMSDHVVLWEIGKGTRPVFGAKADCFVILDNTRLFPHLLWTWSRNLILWDSTTGQPLVPGSRYRPLNNAAGDDGAFFVLPDGRQLCIDSNGELEVVEPATGMRRDLIRAEFSPPEVDAQGGGAACTLSHRGRVFSWVGAENVQLLSLLEKTEYCTWQSDGIITKIDHIFPNGLILVEDAESRPVFLEIQRPVLNLTW